MSEIRPVPPRRWTSFSLRTLLLAVTLVSVVCAIAVRYSAQHRLAREWTRRGGVVTYHPPLFSLPDRIGWYLRDVRSVELSRRPIDVGDFEAMQRLPRLEGVFLGRCELTDPIVRELGRCRRLKKLALWHSTLHDAQVAELADLRELEVLDIHGSRTTEACLETLERLPALRALKFDFPLSDAGLARLAAMPVVAPLPFNLQDVTDVGLRDLEQLDWSRRTIKSFRSSAATDAGLRRMFDKLPPRAFARCSYELTGEQLTPTCLRAIPYEVASRVSLQDTKISLRDLAERTAGLGVQLNVGRGAGIYRGPYLPFEQFSSPDAFSVSPAGDWLQTSTPHLASIRYLSLDGAEDLPVRDTLRKYTSLRHVYTSGELPEGVFEELAELPELETLYVSWNGGVQPRPLAPLVRARKLRRITFTATPFSAEEIRPLGDITSLVELDLHACRFERSVLEAFPNYGQLRGVYSPSTGPTRNTTEPIGGRATSQ